MATELKNAECADCKYEFPAWGTSRVCKDCSREINLSKLAIRFSGKLQSYADSMGVDWDESLRGYPATAFLDQMQPLCQWASANSETGHVEGKITRELLKAMKLLSETTTKLAFESVMY